MPPALPTSNGSLSDGVVYLWWPARGALGHLTERQEKMTTERSNAEAFAEALKLLDTVPNWTDTLFEIHAILDHQLYVAAMQEEKEREDWEDYQAWSKKHPVNHKEGNGPNGYRPLVPQRGR